MSLVMQAKPKSAELILVFLYQENHAIVAWFRESFSGVFRNKNS